MERSELLTTVTTIMHETFDNSEISVTEETNAEMVDEWDSLSHIQFISNLEAEFKVRFALGELQDLKNIGDMLTLISTKIN